MGAAPQGPCDDGGGFDVALRQACDNTTDFVHRPADQYRLLRLIRRLLWGSGRVGLAADGGQHCESQHDERDVAMPAVPGAGLVVVETEFVFGGLEAVLDGPALSFDTDQRRNRRAGGAPGGEEGQRAISN